MKARLGSRIAALFGSLVAVVLLLVARPALAAPEQVAVGIYVTQVASVDLKNNAFTVEFWIWFRGPHRATSPLDGFELIDGKVNSKTNVIKKTLADGQDYAAARVNATVHRQWDLHQYPFDDHDLVITVEDSDLDLARSVYVPDTPSQGIDPDVTVSGWDVSSFDATIESHLYHSNYGDTSISDTAETRYSRYVVTLHAKRKGSTRFLKVAFALLIAVLVAWCAFFIRPKDASPRVSVSVGALFAAAAGTVALNSQLPDMNYSTLTDRLVFTCMGMIGLSLLGTVASLSLHYLGKEAEHRRLDKTGAVLFPLLFLVLFFTFVR
jgi:hypothetical protein